MRVWVLLLTLGAFLPQAKADNLLGVNDLNHPAGNGIPEGYKVVAKVPGEGVPRSADAFIVSEPGSEEGFGLILPADQDIWMSALHPTPVDAGECYVFSVALKWSALNQTGPGAPPHGPGFYIYVHSAITGRHLIAIIKPSAASKDWVTAQIAFDTAEKPDFESIRLLFVSKGIQGTIHLKDATLIQVERDKMPDSPQFLLPNGEKVIGYKLAL